MGNEESSLSGVQQTRVFKERIENDLRSAARQLDILSQSHQNESSLNDINQIDARLFNDINPNPKYFKMVRFKKTMYVTKK